MQPTVSLHVHASFPGESVDRTEYEIGRADFVLWHAGIVFCMLFIIIKVFLQENIKAAAK